MAGQSEDCVLSLLGGDNLRTRLWLGVCVCKHSRMLGHWGQGLA